MSLDRPRPHRELCCLMSNVASAMRHLIFIYSSMGPVIVIVRATLTFEVRRSVFPRTIQTSPVEKTRFVCYFLVYACDGVHVFSGRALSLHTVLPHRHDTPYLHTVMTHLHAQNLESRALLNRVQKQESRPKELKGHQEKGTSLLYSTKQ